MRHAATHAIPHQHCNDIRMNRIRLQAQRHGNDTLAKHTHAKDAHAKDTHTCSSLLVPITLCDSACASNLDTNSVSCWVPLHPARYTLLLPVHSSELSMKSRHPPPISSHACDAPSVLRSKKSMHRLVSSTEKSDKSSFTIRFVSHGRRYATPSCRNL